MLSQAHDDDAAPPSELDLPAALAAEAQYRAAVAGGIPEGTAWSAAVEVFRMHHPSWPLPLAEREAARVVGALIASRRCATAAARASTNHRTPPLHLLRRLARPAAAPRMPRPATPAKPSHVLPFNRVQENAIRGGLTSCGRNAQHRLRRVMSREVPPCRARSA
jgi:hypothetical protein